MVVVVNPGEPADKRERCKSRQTWGMEMEILVAFASCLKVGGCEDFGKY